VRCRYKYSYLLTYLPLVMHPNKMMMKALPEVSVNKQALVEWIFYDDGLDFSTVLLPTL